MKPQYSSLLFPLQISGGTAQSATNVGVETFARLFLPMTAQLRRGKLFWFAPLPVHALTRQPRGGGLGGLGWRGSVLVGVFAPVWTWGRRGGFTWRLRGGNTCWAEAQRCGTAQQSREERSCAGETADHPSTGGTHTTIPYGCLRNTDKSPLPPLFSFSGTFWLLTLSRAEVFCTFKLFAPGCKKKKEKKSESTCGGCSWRSWIPI